MTTVPPANKRRRYEDDDEDDDRPRRRHDDDDDEDDRPRRRKPKASNGLATTALVLGILSFFCFAVTGLPAIVCGFLGLSKAGKDGAGKGMAMTGAILGVLGTLLTALPIYVTYKITKEVNQAVEKFDKESEDDDAMMNLEEIVQAVHEYHDREENRLPSAYHRPKQGKPMPANSSDWLSWRFTLLPYVQERELYRQFKDDQPWNSPTNRPLAATPVHVFSDPGQESDKTRYRVFVGGGAVYDLPPRRLKPGEKIAKGPPRPGAAIDGDPHLATACRMVDITDGLTNTIYAVESADTVPWAQYNELPFDMRQPLPAFGRPGRDTFLVVMCDSSVRVVKKSVNPEVLKKAITKKGGEPLPADW